MRHSRPRLRVGGGEGRGRVLRVGSGSRPTEARVRAALFSIWQDRVVSCRFLDLFAGSGAAGLEALSRGAAYGCLVDSEPRPLSALRHNARELLGGELDGSRIRILRRRLPTDLRGVAGGPFDLAFADPPYNFRDYDGLLTSTVPLLEAHGEFVVEHSGRRSVEACEGLRGIDRRRYGETCLSFFAAA